MTAVPRFSRTDLAQPFEVYSFIGVTIFGLFLWSSIVSVLQPILILRFIISRIRKRKANPPYSFVFIFVGLLLWIVSATFIALGIHEDTFLRLHYEGSIAAIILGVGSKLVPGILGHVDIVPPLLDPGERPAPLWKLMPMAFLGLMLLFIVSYFISYPYGDLLRATVVTIIGFSYWKLHLLPKTKSALTFSIWGSGWFILISFFMKVFWEEGGIHASHAFFINGIVLLSLLIGTRVLQSHGPNDSKLEDWKGIYVISCLVFISSATRVSAYLLPESYLTHLGYSSLILAAAVLIWSYKYLRYIF
jgi:hypothetical protein